MEQKIVADVFLSHLERLSGGLGKVD